MRVEAWVTSAVEEKDVNKALVLAGSLRRVCTAKKLVVFTTFAVPQKLRKKLRETFDLVIPLEQDVPNGLNLEDYAKVEAFSLGAFKKCVYLSPSTLVMRNCDDIFTKYDDFAVWGNEDGLDSSVYLFSPSAKLSESLSKFSQYGNAALDGGKANRKMKGAGRFQMAFNLWIQNNVPKWERLEEQYNFGLDLGNRTPKSLSSTVVIANFGEAHPLDLTPEGDFGLMGEWGLIEKSAVQLCGEIFTEDIKPIQTINHTRPFQLDSHANEPIAIVGLSFRLPGGNNVDEFWELLNSGSDAIHFLPQNRWTREQTYIPCQNRKVEAGFLSVPVDEFDAKFFRISGKEAEYLDPQQRLLHEVAWEALEDAMIDPLSIRGTQTGIFVGSWLHDYQDMLSTTADLEFFRAYMGNSIGAGPARLSHFFETTGPSIGTESGCSSAIVAVDMACKSLRSHDSNLALACGVNLLLHPFDTNALSFVVAPDGRCKTFDEGANGFGRAEGCAVLLLKRISDAARDGDKIWGLIRGSAVTQEGVSKSLGTPTVHCESLAMELALQDADLEAKDISYVEAHGTGTPVGDPLEVAAITKTYSKGRSEPLVIGSVKTNVGHTESVSGITGIIKVILSMKNETIPKHLHLEKLNPAINLDAIPAIIPVKAMPWLKQPNKPRIAGVSSFGITGGDGHVIVQEPPAISHSQFHGKDERPIQILKLSATCKESLETLLTTYENILSGNGNEDLLPNLAYSTNIGRSTFNHRAVIIAKDATDAAKIIRDKSFKQGEVQSSTRQLCFLFTGQGSQYPNMAANLYSTSPIFRDHFDKCEQVLTKQYNIDIRETLWGNTTDGKDLSRTLYSQTSIFCIEYCLLKLWESWGVKPDYVMGHSLGEFAAAVAAGVLGFEDALMLVAERSRLIDALPGGSMLVIKADKDTVSQHIEKFRQTKPNFRTDYAAMNAPDQTVVAGDSEMITEFAKFCGEASLKTIMLAATHAFHSSHMDPMLEFYRQVAQQVKRHEVGKDSPKYISGMEGKLIDLEHIDADYWVRHTREPVRYMDACKVAQSEGCSLFLEIGPHPVLSALTMMNIDGQSVTCLPSIRRKEDEWVTMLDSLAKLYLSEWKGEVDWKGFDRYYKRSRVTVPFYPFNRKSIWKDMETALPTVHPLLGKILPTECDHSIFEKRITLRSSSFAQDHVIGNTVVFPGAGFLEMCVAAGHASLQGSGGDLKKPGRPVALKSLRISTPLALYDSGTYRLQTVTKLDMEDKDEVAYSVGVHRNVPCELGGEGQWVSHATAKFIPVPHMRSSTTKIDIPAIQNSCEKTDNKDFYDRLPEVGLHFGPKFRSIEMGWNSPTGMLVTVKVPEDHDSYLIHPVIGDAMLQAIMLWTSKDRKEKTDKMKLQVPVQIGEFTWLQSTDSASRYIYCSTNKDGKTESILLDEHGHHLATMTDVDFVETSVKLVQEMIQQQEAAMPKIWKDVWKSSPGALQCSYNLETNTDKFLEFNASQQEILRGMNDTGEAERAFYLNLCQLSTLVFVSAMYELGWKPKEGTPFTLEELMCLLPKPLEHRRRYFRFYLHSMAAEGMIEANPEVEDKYCFVRRPPTEAELRVGLKKVTSPGDTERVEYKMAVRTGESLAKLLTGEVDPLQFLFTEDPSKPNIGLIYETLAAWIFPGLKPINDKIGTSIVGERYEIYMKTKKADSDCPVIRVLEIGSGTGIFTRRYLEYLDGLGKPFEFYFTDISAAFFVAAEKTLAKYLRNIVFKKFDMEGDPLAQGLCPKYFDMIVACEALHVSKDIQRTLRNIRCLLKPGGYFQIVETTRPDPRSTMLFGLLEGYWHYEDLDFRPHHITLTPAKWEQALKAIGCKDVACLPAYNDVFSVVIARLSPEMPSDALMTLPAITKPQNSWLIFHHESNSKLADRLKHKLEGVNRKVHLVQRPVNCTEQVVKELIKSEFAEAREGVDCLEGVLYLWGLMSGDNVRDQAQVSLPLINVLHEMLADKFPARLYVVTEGTADVEGFEVSNPSAGTLHGMLKSLTNETVGLHLNCFDLSPEDSLGEQVDEIFYNLWWLDKDNRKFAFRNRKRLCAKMVSGRVEFNEPLAIPSGCDRYQLRLPQTRMISDLEFGVLDNYTLEENEVEVQVKATALNFRDVFAVLKPIAQFEDLNTIGLEFAGIVTKVGPNVTNMKVGDRVIGINMSKNLSLPSHIKTEEQLLVPLPSTFTFAEGVTLPAGFLTAFYCLIQIANMKEGETLLIHTASGGVGLCAIQLAKQMGVEIIATAGSPRKRNYLRNMGIKHVFHSRNTDFGQQILEVTNGRGVDIVLNSLTGEGFKEASLSALTKNGKFIEMSKLNVWKPEEVKELRDDVFYKIADVSGLDRPELENLVEHLKKSLGADFIRPIPYEQFDCVNIRGALNYLQRAKHIGKIVCLMSEVKIQNSKITATTPLFNEFSTYLVTGGLGGIGFEVVKWMLKSGANHIAIASRSSPKPDVASQIDVWNKSGKHVEAFSVDIGNLSHCQNLFKELQTLDRGFPPIRGVMHVAGVLADAILENQSWNTFQHTYNPKVNGTWNLHDLTKDLLLEHFVLFSSMAASIGSPAQSNHAASNKFEDALASYRRSNGLPATTINWGQWGEVGVATELDFPGFRPITTSQGILVIETFLKTQTSNYSVTNVESFALALKLFPSLKYYVDDKRLLGETKVASVINGDGFWKAFDAAEDRESKMRIVKEFIKSTLKNILKMDQHEVIDDLAEFQALGIDSLMMLEMKNGIQNVLGSRLVLNANHLKDCAHTEMLANRLIELIQGDGEDKVKITKEELQQLVREDSILPEHITTSESLSRKDESEIESVLLFGATGVLGPYLLKELSQRPNIKKIICLIRKRGKTSVTERLVKRLTSIGLDSKVDMTKVECIQGDITDERLGLPQEEYTHLAETMDVVVNSAGRIDHAAKYYKAPNRSKNEVRSVNVKGTLRILEFATHSKLKHVYHASTFATVTTTDEEDGCISEEWQDVGAFDQYSFNSGYLLSKHISEQLCKEAVMRGIPVKVFRLPNLGGDSETGRFDYLTNHMVLRWLAYMKLGCMPDIPTPLMVMPIDVCTRISLDVFFNPQAPPNVYNIFQKTGGMDQSLISIAEEFGITVELVTIFQFLDKLKEVKEDSPLALIRQIYEGEEDTIKDNLEGNNPNLKIYQKYVENSSEFFRSRKLPRLIDNYDELESTEVVVTRDVRYLKESGVFEKLGIKS